MSNIPLTDLPKSNPFPVTLYRNIYRSKGGQLVVYQNMHETLESAKATFVTQHNGDKPEYILEIQGLAHV